jgi:hypothetical protein
VSESLGQPADGRIEQYGPDSLEKSAVELGISVAILRDQLSKFSGVVSVVTLNAGSVLYRTIGLTASPEGLHFGSVTNRLDANYWEAKCPSEYKNINEWRASVAVMAEWNGDFGYVRVVLARPLTMLYGKVGMQKVARAGDQVLPGGGAQYFIPRLSNADLTEPLTGRPLTEVVQQTSFQDGRK